MDKNSSSILVAGDLVINQEYDVSKLDKKLVSLFQKSDLNIVNLEAPVTASNSKILKTGPYLKAHEESTKKILKALNVDIVTLANNHVLDYDEKGVDDTLDFCRKNKIKTVGAGMNLEEAAKTLYVDTKEGKIALVNFAENEWASATDKTAGANPMDVIDNAKQIQNAREQADYVIVIIHGGHEYYNLPSPRMQKQYRFYAEQGADIIIGHHTHCISGKEVYKGVPIYYSLGNFLFTNPSSFEDWYIGIVLELTIINGKLEVQLHPVKQTKEYFQISLLEGEEKQNVYNRIFKFDTVIEDSIKLNNEWKAYVDSKYRQYLNYWSPISFVNNRLLKSVLIKLGVSLINKKGIALKLNMLRCEAHKDMSKEFTLKYLKK